MKKYCILKNLRSEKGYKLIVDTEKNLLNNIRIWCMNNKDEMKYYFEEQLIDNINRDIWPENMILHVVYYYKGIKNYIDEKTVLNKVLPDLDNIELGIECNGYILGEALERKSDYRPVLPLLDINGTEDKQVWSVSEIFEESQGNFFYDDIDSFGNQETYHTVEMDQQGVNSMINSDGNKDVFRGGDNYVDIKRKYNNSQSKVNINNGSNNKKNHKDTYNDYSGEEYTQNTARIGSILAKKYILLTIIGLFVIAIVITGLLLKKYISSNYEKKSELADNSELTEETIISPNISNKRNEKEVEVFKDSIIETEETKKEWSDWVEEIPENITENDYEIRQKTQYSSCVREMIETESNYMNGWTLYDSYTVEIEGEWSDWSDEKIVLNDNMDVKEKKMYKYREVEKTESESSYLDGWTNVGSREEWGDYGAWSDWSFDVAVESDTRQVRTRKVSSYYYFYCNRCGRGARYPFHGYNCELCGTKSVYLESGTVEWFETPWSNSTSWGSGKYYQYIDGGIWWNYSDGIGQDGKTQYQYQDLNKKIIYYHERLGEWSEWSDEAIEDTETREVKSKTMYQYRENETKTIYIHERLGEWSDFGDNEIPESEGREIKTRVLYSYKKK